MISCGLRMRRLGAAACDRSPETVPPAEFLAALRDPWTVARVDLGTMDSVTNVAVSPPAHHPWRYCMSGEQPPGCLRCHRPRRAVPGGPR